VLAFQDDGALPGRVELGLELLLQGSDMALCVTVILKCYGAS